MSILSGLIGKLVTGDVFGAGSADALSGSLEPSALLIAGASLVVLGLAGKRIFWKRSKN